jgi:hypothetical protein
MHSYIKKSTIIRDFRMQIDGKSKAKVKMLDTPFFDTINRVFRNKPHDVKFHITKENTLVFNIDFTNNVNVYLEHFPESYPSTLMTLCYGGLYDENTQMENSDLTHCLDIIEESVTTQHDSNPTDA